MVQTLMKIEKTEGKIKSKGIIGVRFVPMIGHSRQETGDGSLFPDNVF